MGRGGSPSPQAPAWLLRRWPLRPWSQWLRARSSRMQGMRRLLVPLALLTLPSAWAPLQAASADPGFAAFLADWRAAVARGDAEAVARRLRGPFLWEGRRLDAVGFRRHAWPVLFTPALRRCWAHAAPVAEPGQPGERTLFCDAYALHFDARDGRWALREFSADGEGR